MNNEMAECPYEDRVLRAIRSDELPQWSEHVASCSVCRSLVAVVKAFRDEAGPAKLQATYPQRSGYCSMRKSVVASWRRYEQLNRCAGLTGLDIAPH
jgi:hypothetical protein